MALEVTRLTKAEFEDGIDFINLVFSQNSVPHDFKHLTPRWCRDDTAEYNVVVKRDGKIRACIMSAPQQLLMAGHTLKGFGIGNVSTHLDERRHGLMRMAMTQVLADAQAEGADLMFLGGHRQRYGYYGFERCGIRYNITVEGRNFRHAHIDAPAYTFEPLTGPEDPALRDIRALYEKSPLRVERGGDKDFWQTLLMWTAVPYVCRKPDGAFAGYLCVKEPGESILEYDAVCKADLRGILQSWFEYRSLPRLSFSAAPWDRDFLRDISTICESLTVAPDHQYRVFHWDAVVGALLDVRALYGPMADGEVVLQIGEWGNLALRVSGGRPECGKTNLPADITLTEFEAVRMLFGPAEPGIVKALPPKAELVLRSWCPLPLSWHSLDNV